MNGGLLVVPIAPHLSARVAVVTLIIIRSARLALSASPLALLARLTLAALTPLTTSSSLIPLLLLSLSGTALATIGHDSSTAERMRVLPAWTRKERQRTCLPMSPRADGRPGTAQR